MLIQKEKQAGLNFPEWFKNQIIKERNDSILKFDTTDEEKQEAMKRVTEVVDEKDNKFYVFTDAAYKISQSLKFDSDKFETSFLSIIPNGKKVTYLMGDTFYRWHKTDTDIMVFGCNQTKLSHEQAALYKQKLGRDYEYNVAWYFFKIFLKDNLYSTPPIPNPPFTDDTWIEFLKMIIFTELSELETVVLPPNTKTGTKKSGRYKNESNRNIVIVDSAWSKTLIKSDGFLVSGHSRMQPVGEGLKYRKLIWIDSYEKNGHKRDAKKMRFL